MKSKKIFVLVSSLALLLGACNKPASTSQSQQGSESANPTTSETSNTTSQGGQTEVAVTALAINKPTLSLEAGKSETLTVTVTPNNASNTKVTWESSDATVATVSSLGKVTAVKVGTATITVKSQSNPTVTATCAVTVTEEGGKYGSVNKPKTVAQILAIAAQECKEKDDKTADVVYVKGIVTKAPTYNAEKGFSQNIYLKDAMTDEKDLLVYSANHDALKIPYQNDEVVLHGYLMNYNGTTIEISNVTLADGTKNYPAIDSVTRGTSTITYNVEHGTVNADAPKSAKNNSEFSFTVTPEQGYKVDNVTVNGDAVTAGDNGAYKAYVKGNTVVNIDISQVGVDMKTATMECKPETSTNMGEGNNAAAIGLDPNIFDVRSDNPTGNYCGLNAAGNFRLYNGYGNAEDKTHGTKVTVSSRKVTVKKIVVTLAASTVAGLDKLEVKAGDTVVTGNEGAYEIDNGTFSLKNVSNATVSDQIHISKVVISYVENVEVAATAIAVTPKELTLKVDQTGSLSAALTPANATDTIVWETSDATKVKVDQAGIVTAVAEGEATITAKVSDTIKDTAKITVEAAEVLNYGTAEAPLNIAEAKALLDKLGSGVVSKQPLFVKGIISTNKAFSSQYHNGEVWLQSDDGTVEKAFELYRCELDASLNYSGDPAADELKGYEVVATGYAKIHSSTYELTNANDASGTNVNPKIISMKRQEVPATAIAVAPTTAEVEVGKTVDLAATLTPTNATQKVAWKSSDEAKATVADGKVTGVAEGSVTITAFVDADKDGVLDDGELKADAAITVKAANQNAERVIDFSTKAVSHNNYADTWTYGDATVAGGANNNGQWAFVKMGGKSSTISAANHPGTYIKTNTAVAYSVASVSIKFVGKCYNQDNEKATVKVEAYSDEALATKVAETAAQEVPAITTDSGTNTLTFTFTAAQAANMYYKINFDIVNTTNYNGVVALEKVTFTAAA